MPSVSPQAELTSAITKLLQGPRLEDTYQRLIYSPPVEDQPQRAYLTKCQGVLFSSLPQETEQLHPVGWNKQHHLPQNGPNGLARTTSASDCTAEPSLAQRQPLARVTSTDCLPR